MAVRSLTASCGDHPVAEQPKWSAEAAVAEEELPFYGKKADGGRNSLMTNVWLQRGLSRIHFY